MRLLFIALLCISLAPPVAGEPLVAGKLEASTYSLPNVVASADWQVEPEGVLLAESPHPEIVLPWRTAVNANGARAKIEYTLRILSDRGFPGSPDEDWQLEFEDRVFIDAHGRSTDGGKGTDRSGQFVHPVPINYAAPVRRYKIQARLKVHNEVASVLLVKPSQIEETFAERTFFIALRPRWKEGRHQTDSLIRAMAVGSARMRGVRAWLDYVADVRRAGETPQAAARFGADRIAGVLERIARISARGASDPELKEAAKTIVTQSQILTGTMPDKDGPKLKLPAGGGEYGHVARELSSRARELVSTGVAPLAYVVTFNAAARSVKLEERLQHVLEATAKETESLQRLWMVNSAPDLAAVLAGYGKALAAEKAAIEELGRAIERELGRDYKARAWKKIQESALFRQRVPKNAPGDKAAIATLARTIYQGLYYFLKAERFRVAMLASAAQSGLAPIRDVAKFQMPDFESEVPDYPIDLQVKPEQTIARVERGEVAEYAIVVRHAGNRAREIRVQYGKIQFPKGWHRRLTDTSFTLRPGQARRIVYAVSTPKTALEPENFRSSLLVYYADQPANSHHVDFLTRMTVGGRALEMMGPAWDHPDRLIVRALDADDHIFPGQIATYRFLVTHRGHSRRGMTSRIVNRPPPDFVVKLSPERAVLLPGQTEEFLLKVSAPLTAKDSSHVDWQVVFAYDDELTDPERVQVRTSFTNLTVLKSKPVLNQGKVFTYHLPPGQSTQTLLVENRGNEADTYDFSIVEPAEGWFVDFPTNHAVLSPEEPRAEFPFRASAPREAEGGAFAHVTIKMASANHPEVVTTATITLVKSGGNQVVVAPLAKRILIAPGQVKEVGFVARNRSEEPIELGFKADPRNPLPEALEFEEVPVQRLEPEAELEMSAVVTLPENLPYRVGQVVPVGIAGYDALGGKIVMGHADLVVAPLYGVALSLHPEDARRSPGLFIGRLTIKNTGTAREDFALLLSGKRRTWGRLSRNRVTLDPGHSTHVTLYVRVPSDAQPGQVALLEVQAKSAHNSAVRSFVQVDATP